MVFEKCSVEGAKWVLLVRWIDWLQVSCSLNLLNTAALTRSLVWIFGWMLRFLVV